MHRPGLLSFILFLSLTPSMAFANALLLGVDVTIGGDKTTTFSDDTSQRAGDGIGLYIGYELEVSEEKQLFLQASVGKSEDDPNVSNGHTELKRTPYILTLMKQIGNHQIGGGLAYHNDPSWNFSVTGIGSGNVNYDNALGGVIQYGWQFSRFGELGARYTSIKYDPSNGGSSIDASSIAVFMNFKLHH